MTRKVRMAAATAAFFWLLVLGGCEGQLEDPAAVSAITVVWHPAHTLRLSPLKIDVDPKLLGIFIDRLNLSQPIDPIWRSDVQLYEGSYTITVFKKDGGRDVYELGGESVLYDPATKKYYQNKDVHLFVYENLFLELVKRGITIP